MRFRVGDIVKFSKNGRDFNCDDSFTEGTSYEGTVADPTFSDRTSGFCIHVKWDCGYPGDLCSERELRLVRRATEAPLQFTYDDIPF